MTFEHKAKHLVLNEVGVLFGPFDELRDAISVAELEASNSERDSPKGFIFPVTEVTEV